MANVYQITKKTAGCVFVDIIEHEEVVVLYYFYTTLDIRSIIVFIFSILF